MAGYSPQAFAPEAPDSVLDLPVSTARLVLPVVLPMTAVWVSMLNPVVSSTTTVATASALTAAWVALFATARIMRWGIRATATELTIRAVWPWRRSLAWEEVVDVELVRRLGVSQVRITTDTGKRVWLPAPLGYGWSHPAFDAAFDQLTSWHSAHRRYARDPGTSYPWPSEPTGRSPWAPPPGT